MKYRHHTITLLSVISLLCTGMSVRLHAQAIKGVAIAGFNATQVDGDEVFGYHKFGLNLGASAIIPINKRWMIGLENIYNQKGAIQRAQYADSAKNGAYRLLLNYVEVPLLLLYEDKETMTFGTGVSWGRLFNVKEYEHGFRVDSTTLSGPYHRSDWNILVDVRFRIYQQLKFNFRYAYSIVKIRERHYYNFHQGAWDRKQYNNVLSFRLLYYFNEKPSKKRKKTDDI
ncbi:MAG TPA: porin family protein [Bacteroidales bacterium]|nr:porin family protein [Bacteroidales bacterium]HSA43640.1 porin family protein [Bacteroidales bacterium]